jgi:hypothetical protein
LIATVGLTGFGGADLYTRDLALALLGRGWLPVVYSTQHGRIADELRRATVPVVSRLDSIGAAPDIIHGHTAIETIAALARFPGVPAIFVCHDALTWHSLPPRSPRIAAYVAVDNNCRDRMVLEHGVPEDSIRVMTNAVDLRRFVPRPPLPAKPARALVFSNQAQENLWVSGIRTACGQRGISLDVIGIGAGRFAENPEHLLGGYDVIFAKARCALEALATGAAVVVADRAGMAGMVTSANVAELQKLNFGARTLQRPITAENVLAELNIYDPADAAAVSRRIRETSGIDVLAGQFAAIYEEVLLSPPPVPVEDDFRAAGETLERVLPLIYAAMTPPRTVAALMKRFIVNFRPLALVARLLYRLKRLPGV